MISACSRSKAVACLIVTLAFTGCMRSPEAKSAKYMQAGKKLLDQHDPARAVLQFRNAVQSTPKNAEAHYQLALAYLAAGDIAGGYNSLRQAVKLNPKHAEAQLRLSALLVSSGRADWIRDANTRLQGLVADRPKDPDALHALALTEMKLGAARDATQHLEEALRNAPQDLVIAVTLAQAKMQQNDLAGAEATLKAACAKDPKSSDAAVILGRFYASQKRMAEAREQFQKGLALNADGAGALLNMAFLEYGEGRKSEAEQYFKRLSSSSIDSVNYLYGVFLLDSGRSEEAIHEFARLSRANPGSRADRTRLIAAYHQFGRTADAEKLINDAIRRNPRDVDALLQRGELLVEAGKLREAQADFNSVLKLNPDSPQLHFAMATLHRKAGDAVLQRQELSEAVRLSPGFLAGRLELARALLQGNSTQAAIDTLDGAPEEQKHTIPFIEQRTWALLAAGRTQEARKAVDAALPLQRTPDLLLEDAFLKGAAGRYPEARAAIYEAAAKNPEDLRLLQALVQTYVAQKQTAAAVDEVKKYAVQHPRSAPIQYFLGTLLSQTGDRAGAKAALVAAKASDPNYFPADVSLAQMDLTQANWTDARKDLNAMLARKQDDAQAHLWLGMLEASVGNNEAAIVEFRKTLETQPDNPKALNNIAYLLAEQGDNSEKPLQYAQRARELEPANPGFADTLGWVLYRKGVYGLAVQHLAAAVEKLPTAVTQYHLGMALYKTGQRDGARQALNAALRLNPQIPEAPEIRRVLESVGGNH